LAKIFLKIITSVPANVDFFDFLFPSSYPANKVGFEETMLRRFTSNFETRAWHSDRVTGLGEFSPFWRLIYPASFLITAVSQTCKLLFSTLQVVHKFGLGYTLGDFFANTSGHPALHRNQKSRAFLECN
jgi:hypothetical protein